MDANLNIKWIFVFSWEYGIYGLRYLCLLGHYSIGEHIHDSETSSIKNKPHEDIIVQNFLAICPANGRTITLQGIHLLGLFLRLEHATRITLLPFTRCETERYQKDWDGFTQD